MEDARRDNDSSPRPTDNPIVPIQTDSSISTQGTDDPAPASTLESRSTGKSPPQSQPFQFEGFEGPSFSHIATLTVLCLTTYPAFYILTLVAKDKSLFVVRLIVSAWCSGIGFALGYILLAIGAQHLEAASESTLVEY